MGRHGLSFWRREDLVPELGGGSCSASLGQMEGGGGGGVPGQEEEEALPASLLGRHLHVPATLPAGSQWGSGILCCLP